MAKKGRIGILTGGGDCPGENAVIRAVTKMAILNYGLEVIGINDGFDGAIHNKFRRLRFEDVSGIITLGGTILGTSNTANPYHHAVLEDSGPDFTDVSRETITNLSKMELDCLICIGGDGTMSISSRLFKDGIPVVGVPKTIDNDLLGTDITFGFDTATSIATEAIDRVHTTAQSHHRVMVVEVMGRNAGWIALQSGIAGGGDIIVIPEIPYDIKVIAEKVRERTRKGKRFSIIVVSEGARAKDGDVVIKRIVSNSTDPIRYGGIGFVMGAKLEEITQVETRTVVLGHLQRGGTPTAFDRVLATRLGTRAVEMAVQKHCGNMVGVRGNSLVEVPLEEVARGQRKILPDEPLLQVARSVGTSFGDR